MGTWSWKRWLAIGLGVVLVLVVVGPWVYIHLIEGPAPAPLGLGSPSAAATGAPASSIDPANAGGEWAIADGSVVGYRVAEVLFGQDNEAVGRTDAITGSMTIDGTTVTAASFTVDMTTVTSDQARRDEQFDGRIMETSIYPTATFTLTEPIELGDLPAEGQNQTYSATGDLELHGVTRSVTFDVDGRYSGSLVQIAGSIPIAFADWNIGNPSFGPVTTEDHGTLEFALDFNRG